MPGPVRSLVPHAFVSSMKASIGFYRQLGLSVANSFTPEGAEEPSWYLLSSERGALMLGIARERFDAARQGILFYAHCDDLAATHALLSAAGLNPGPITWPFLQSWRGVPAPGPGWLGDLGR